MRSLLRSIEIFCNSVYSRAKITPVLMPFWPFWKVFDLLDAILTSILWRSSHMVDNLVVLVDISLNICGPVIVYSFLPKVINNFPSLVILLIIVWASETLVLFWRRNLWTVQQVRINIRQEVMFAFFVGIFLRLIIR